MKEIARANQSSNKQKQRFVPPLILYQVRRLRLLVMVIRLHNYRQWSITMTIIKQAIALVSSD